jgi:hypothetical protein
MISVLLPVRDGAATLDVALRSLREQTLPPDRVWAVDDGSTDSTEQILTRRSVQWPALRMLRTAGVGVAAALNRALECALAEPSIRWLARMDADDRCEPERLSRQLALTASDPALALVGCEVRHGGGTEAEAGMRRHVEWANSLHSHDELELGLWVDSPLPHPGWLVRADAFATVGPYVDSRDMPEDYEWLHRFFATARVRGWRAGKPRGGALLDWNESPGRLTRQDPAYAESAFLRVKARALARHHAARAAGREVHLLGLGPKAKALLPLLAEAGLSVSALVDVHPGKVGQIYGGFVTWGVDAWRARVREREGRVLAVSCLGSSSAREACFALCRAEGLDPLEGYLGL